MKGSYVITSARKGFTLVELLTVLVIISILTVLVGFNLGGLLGSNNFGAAANGISLALTQARAYALAHHTYVYVGLEESNVTKPSLPSPQTAVTSSTTVGGRVILAVVASADGTSDYSIYSPAALPASDLVQIQKPAIFNNVHLADLSTVNFSTGSSIANRPAAAYQVSDGAASLLTFNYPLGTSSSSAQCAFTTVIQFDPRGTAYVVTSSGPASLLSWMEIGLQPTKGTVVPASAVNCAAIQLEGTTGAVQVYRP